MSRLTDRLEELPADARAAVLLFFDMRGLGRLTYYRHLYETGRLAADTTPHFAPESYAEDAFQRAVRGDQPTTLPNEEYYWA